MLRQIRSIRHSITQPLLSTLVSSLILTRVDYNISVFSGISSTQVHRLQSVLNASARLLFRASRFSSVTPLLQKLNWLPVKCRVQYRLAVLAFLCRQNRAPSYLANEILDSASQARRPNMRSSVSGKVIQPRTKHPTLGGRSFSAAASNVWNSLPPALRLADNVRVFKKRLKAHFLATAF